MARTSDKHKPFRILENGGDKIDCQTCATWREIKRRMRIGETISKSIESMQDRMNCKGFKLSVSEYLRLVQVEQDWERKEPQYNPDTATQFTWVEPEAMSQN